MQDISNSLRQRLGARPVPQEHPDADLLSAYTEQALPAAERAVVVLHLAECSYCREVVSLNLSLVPERQVKPEQQIQPVVGRSRFWILGFRWGAAVATVAIAATLWVEKPWKTPPTGSRERAELTQPAPPAPPSAAVTGTLEPPVTPNSSARDSVPALPARASAEAGPSSEKGAAQRTASAPPQALGVVGGVVGRASQPVPPMPAPETAASKPVLAQPAQHAAFAAAYKDAGQGYAKEDYAKQDYVKQDYVNTNVLRADNSAADGNPNGLPPAPAPQRVNGSAAGGRARTFPAIALGDVGSRAMAPEVVPPKTAPAAGSSASDTNLSKSNGFGYKLKSTISTAVNAVKKAGATQSGRVEGFSSRRLAGPTFRPPANADNTDAEDATTAQGPSQFRIGPDGILMKTTDYTKWHEAYPQSSDLHLKVVLPKGDQVWAGGNNGTLIHSWNAGVDWETMKVPDSGDITAIAVDDVWQVKTSNGQTFVSQDNGKTWVPLQTQPK
jgi:hypothetical protein